jgi:aryl-alcohol dehydrogenase-like predicted oxidoreductase
MEYRPLGRSGLRVSALALGTMGFGGRGNFACVGTAGVDEARNQVDMSLDAGVNLIDTADVYSRGLAEELVGEVLGGRRDRVVLATKVRMRMGEGPNDTGLSRHSVLAGCEASLRRLRTDHIDLYQLHGWDGQTPVEETLEALDQLVREGKIRYVGASNLAGWQLMKALGAAACGGLPKFVSHQIFYSLQARDAEYELIPAAVDQGLGVLVWSPLAGGLLSGKQSVSRTPHYLPPVRDEKRLAEIVELLAEIGAGHGVSAAPVAVAYLLGRPAVTSVVIGARTTEQLADNLKAATLELSAEERQRLDEASALPLLYPYWHQARTVSDRLSPADLTLLDAHIARG